MLGSLAKGLAFLRAVDAAQADTFGLLVVQNFERVAVEEGDDSGGQAGGQQWRAMVPFRSILLRGGFKFQVQRVNDGAVAHRLPGAWQS